MPFDKTSLRSIITVPRHAPPYVPVNLQDALLRINRYNSA